MFALMGEIEYTNEESHQSFKQFSSQSKPSDNKKENRGLQEPNILTN